MTDADLIKAREDAMVALGAIAKKDAKPKEIMLAVDAIIAATLATLTLYYGGQHGSNADH